VLELAHSLEQALQGIEETKRPVPDIAKLAKSGK